MKLKSTIFGLLLLLSHFTSAAQVELTCPCDVDALGLTGLSITAGISNPDSSAAGKLRYRVIGYQPASGLEGFRQDTFFTIATYGLADSLSAGASISSSTVKTGMTVPASSLTLALLLEELVGTTWTRRDFARLSPAVSLGDGGESAFSSTDAKSSAIYLDGLATLSVFGAEATIQLPAIGNSSSTFATGTLSIDVLQTTSSTALSFSGATFAVNPVTIAADLPPRSLLGAQTVTAPFSDGGSGNFYHLRVKDAEGTLAYQTVLNSTGTLPTRTLDTTNIRVLDDTDGDGVKDYSETLLGTDPTDSASKPTSNIIDTLVIYSQSVPAIYGGDPSARIDQLIALSNQVYQSSGLELSLRLASSTQKTMDESATLNTLLSAMDDRSGSFSDLDTLKANASADIVILMLPNNPNSDLCGLANLGGFGSRGDFLSENNRANANGTVFINCGDDTTTVHEIGHILGLGHSRKQDPTEGGTFSWAVGYGVDANFVTVMAYGSEFANANTILKHASPDDIGCNNLPCGIAKTDSANGADAVQALRVSQYQVAKYYASAASATDTDGDGTPDTTDTDDDNDGVPDVSDAFPTNSSEFVDTDSDGTGNNADTDDDNDGTADTDDAFPLDATRAANARLVNIATRDLVGTGNEVLIGGLIIAGDSRKTVVIRARGESLIDADPNLQGLLADPTLQLFSGPNLIDSNDNWQSHARSSEIRADLQPSRSNEAVIMTTLEPGAYTAIVRGVNETSGIGIVEIFEVDDSGATRLNNIATRGFVGTGNNVLIGGVIITGTTPKTVTIRARGPSLADADPNLQNLLADPLVQLFDSTGTLIDSNDNWEAHESAGSLRADLKPSRSQEAVITRSLAPGAYTAIVRGVGETSGIGIVEVFEIN